MDILYFLRESEGIGDCKYYHCFFIPEEDKFIVKQIVNNVEIYNITVNPHVLEEPKTTYNERDPYEFERKINLDERHPNFLDMRKFEINDDPKRLEDIIENVKEVYDPNKKLRSNIDFLLNGTSYSKLIINQEG